MNTIWSIRTGIRDFIETIHRSCKAWIEKYAFIKTMYAIFSWLSLIMFVFSLFFVKESRTMMVQYLWSFYVLLQFWFLCRSKTMPWKPIVLFVLAGVFLVVPFTTLTVNTFHVLFGGKTSDTWSIAVLTPIFEELWKLLPLGIFLLFSRRASALSLSDYTLIGAATGVGFQLMEELSRRWLSSGVLAEKYGYSFSWLGGETIHWDFFSLFPGRFEESLFPTLMTVGHPVHTAMIALACGIAYRLRTRLTKWVFLFPAIIVLWSILDHAAYNGQHKLPGWVFRLHEWTGSGYKTQPVFLLMLAASLIADYWSLNKIRSRLPSLPNEPLLNPFTELWNMIRSLLLDRGKFIYWLGFYRERRELGFHLLYGNEEAADRKEPIQARVRALYQALSGLAVILLAAGLFAGIGAHTGGGETACFACKFDSLQDWWDRLEWYEQGAIVLGALALSLLFVGFWPAFGFAMTTMGIAGSGHEIAGYIRNPKKLLTPENALGVAVGIVLSRIPFGKALGWLGKKGRGYVRKLLDKLGSRKPDILRTEEVIAPQSGKAIRVYTDGDTIIPVDKIEKYLRGKVNVNIQEVTKELRELKQLKQTQRKVFDADRQNAERMKKLEKMKHNFERSDDMRQKLESVGLHDTIENNQSIAKHLLEVGKQIKPGNTLDFPSVLEGPNGKKLKVLTTWKMVDGQPYLSTIKLIPTTT
ncbi:PrsW family glutamic-type intramembrane protease [Paenibacillus spongiae]|uniref:PrsW family glutamic-type intramembrane protease n=1 Tax=Paenibacillus spongiae TaxID=2909671 RepID=A0ABY5SHG7_9BACL|nr:PrsW family glutamic-type intramembrane protease [Paenibacillus spongiae]UVI33429.1 PrsW family glutamic-type intramembrane protease [Paenibacillus spongiae]